MELWREGIVRVLRAGSITGIFFGLQALTSNSPIFGSRQQIGRQHLYMPSARRASCTLWPETAASGILTTVAVMTPAMGNWVSSDLGMGRAGQ